MDIQEVVQQGIYPRTYRKCTLPYSLNPAIAYALNVIGEPSPKDRVLDPCCGTGTVLIERQLLNHCECIGVDIDPRALDCARQNIQAAGVDVKLKHGDIQNLKFPEGYFTKIISNLPYGIHAGSRNKNVRLYRFLADEAAAWLRVGGKAILLTNAKSLLRNSFAHNGAWELISESSLGVNGLTLAVFVFQKII